MKLNELDEIIGVDDGDAIIMAQRITSQLGIGIGISSGANFIGAVIAQNKLGRGSVAATVFSDDNKKYLSTDLLRAEPVKKGFFSPDIELAGFRAIKRVCPTCCDPRVCGSMKVPEDFLEAVNSKPTCPVFPQFRL
jgi:cysteine synthase A